MSTGAAPAEYRKIVVQLAGLIFHNHDVVRSLARCASDSRRASEPEPTHLEAFSCSGIFGGRVMNADFFRRFAQQCRDLIARARSEPAKEQLRLWAEEFDARADAVERGLCDQPDRK